MCIIEKFSNFFFHLLNIEERGGKHQKYVLSIHDEEKSVRI